MKYVAAKRDAEETPTVALLRSQLRRAENQANEIGNTGLDAMSQALESKLEVAKSNSINCKKSEMRIRSKLPFPASLP